MPLHILQNLPENDPDNALSTAVAQQFATRPTLRSVGQSLLERLLKEYFPGLVFDLPGVRLFVPDGRGYSHRALLDAALQNLCSWEPLQMRVEQQTGFLGTAEGVKLKLDGQVLDPDTVREVVKVFGLQIVTAFQEALMAYWQARISESPSRLDWLAQTLAQAAAPLARQAYPWGDMVAQVVLWREWPTRSQHASAPAKAYLIDVQLDAALHRDTMLLSDLLIVSGNDVLLCKPNGQATTYASMAAFGEALGAELESVYQIVGLKWQLVEVERDPFLVQAECLLNQQLEALQALRLDVASVAELEGLFASASDIAARLAGNPTFVPGPQQTQLQGKLPQWLQQASAADYQRYRLFWMQMVLAQQRTGGKAFDHGIAPIRDYAASVLREGMASDHPDGPGYDPYKLVLTFKVPYGQGGFGFVETVPLLLTDAALENLSGWPKGPMTVSHFDGEPVEPWLTAEYVKALIARVDVGANYLKLIEGEMRADSTKASERRQLFSDQLRVQLPLLALEYKIRSEQGFTREGLRCVVNAMSLDAASQVSVRPLAFLSGEGAMPDGVDNMYVFNTPGKPQLVLYRPFFEPALREFADEAALFEALKEHDLEASVLSWMSSSARRVFANGGFADPHLGVTVDDPFGIPQSNVPRLGNAALTGDLLAQFYDNTVSALIALGDRESVSNAEDRWLRFKEGGWLLFSVVMPYLRGPLAVAAWILQLISSLDNDFRLLRDGDEQERAQATADLLFNLLTVFLYAVGEIRTVQQPRLVRVKPSDLHRGLPVHAPGVTPATGLVLPVQQPVEKMQLPSILHTALDFSFSGARSKPSPQLREKLEQVQVKRESQLEIIKDGQYKGLVMMGGHLHVLTRGLLLRVVDTDGSISIVDPADTTVGICRIRMDEKGVWQLDLSMRLSGGGPKPKPKLAARLSPTERRQLNMQKIIELTHRLEAAQQACADNITRSEPKMKEVNTALEPMNARQREYQINRSAANLSAMKEARARAKEAAQVYDADQLDYIELLKKLIEVCREKQEVLRKADVYGDINAEKYSASLTLVYRVHLQARVQVQVQYHSRQYKVVLRDAWVEDALQVTLGDAPQPFSELLKCNEESEKYTLLALEQAEAVDMLIKEIRDSRVVKATADELVDYATTLRTRTLAFSAQKIRAKYLEVLAYMSIDTRIADPLQRRIFKELLADPEVFAGIESHEQLSIDGQEFTQSERIQVLQEASRCYSRARATALYMSDLYPPVAGKDYLAQFVQVADALDASAKAELDSLTLEPEDPLLPKPPRKRKVIYTRKRRVLIGRVRQQTADEPAEIVDIETADQRIMASFRKHDEEDWNEIKTVLPKPASGLRTRKVLLKEGRELLSQVQPLTLKQQKFSASQYQPGDIVFPLTVLADRLTGLATELARHTGLKPGEQEVLDKLNASATGLREEVRAIRLKMCKAQKPTAYNLLYLWEEKQVEIRLTETRKKLKAGDFIDEYKVQINGAGNWYVHFHYPEPSTSTKAFSKGHIKLESQKNLGYADMLTKAQQTGKLEEIWRADLTPAFVRGWFPLRADS